MWIKTQNFSLMKKQCIWKCRLRYGGHFVQGEMNRIHLAAIVSVPLCDETIGATIIYCDILTPLFQQLYVNLLWTPWHVWYLSSHNVCRIELLQSRSLTCFTDKIRMCWVCWLSLRCMIFYKWDASIYFLYRNDQVMIPDTNFNKSQTKFRAVLRNTGSTLLANYCNIDCRK